MRKSIFAVVLFSLLTACDYFDPHDHAVLVDSGLGWGSGVVVDGGVLTAAHVHDVIAKDDDATLEQYTIHFEGEEYPVTGYEYYGEGGTKTDWVLLHVDIPAKPAPVYCGDLDNGQRVSVVGYPSAANLPIELQFHGRISSLDIGDDDKLRFKNTVGLDLAGAPGISGAGVFNKYGEVIGLYVGGLYHSTQSHTTGLMTRLPSEICGEENQFKLMWDRFIRWVTNSQEG